MVEIPQHGAVLVARGCERVVPTHGWWQEGVVRVRPGCLASAVGGIWVWAVVDVRLVIAGVDDGGR